jgi:hypothetical protein
MVLAKKGEGMSMGAMKDCYATAWSYGEICVRCNCCGRFDKDKKKVTKARLRYAREQLKHQIHFNSWGYTKEVREMQKENIKYNKVYWKKEIKKLIEIS